MPTRINRVIIACVVALSILCCVLILFLPPDSLIVDLVYQGF